MSFADIPHTGFAPVPSCGSSQSEVLSSACVNVPLTLICRIPSRRPGQPFPGSSLCLSFSDYEQPHQLHPEGPGLLQHLLNPLTEERGKKKKIFRGFFYHLLLMPRTHAAKLLLALTSQDSGAGAGQPLVAASQEIPVPKPVFRRCLLSKAASPDKPQPVLLQCPTAHKY